MLSCRAGLSATDGFLVTLTTLVLYRRLLCDLLLKTTGVVCRCFGYVVAFLTVAVLAGYKLYGYKCLDTSAPVPKCQRTLRHRQMLNLRRCDFFSFCIQTYLSEQTQYTLGFASS